MEYEKVLIEYENFKPNSDLEHISSEVADVLHMDAPSDAHLKLVVERGKEKFRGYCRIASKVGVFVAEEFSLHPEGALAKIEREIKKQLHRWKRHRFNNLSPTV